MAWYFCKFHPLQGLYNRGRGIYIHRRYTSTVQFGTGGTVPLVCKRGAILLSVLSKWTLRNQEEDYDIPGLGCKRGQKFQCSLSSKSEPAGQNQYIMISRNIVSHQKHICAIKMDMKEGLASFGFTCSEFLKPQSSTKENCVRPCLKFKFNVCSDWFQCLWMMVNANSTVHKESN